MSKICALINIERVFINTVEYYKYDQPESWKICDAIINTPFIQFVRTWKDVLQFVYYYSTITIDDKTIKQYLENIIIHSKLDLGSIINDLCLEGFDRFIIIDSLESYNVIKNSITVKPGIDINPVITSLFSSFPNKYFQNATETDSVACFAESVVDIENYLALLSSKYEYSRFNIKYSASQLCNPVFLFHYYPVGKTDRVFELLSLDLLNQLKQESSNSYILDFFSCSLKHFIDQAEIDIHQCAFAIVPSHEENCWNNHLLSSIENNIIKPFHLKNTLKAIRRITTVEPQKTNKNKIIEDQINSIVVDYSIISEYKYLFVIDDITTSGITLSACKVKCEKGFAGKIFSLAVAATNNRFSQTSVITASYLNGNRLEGKTGYLVDLDNTLVDSNIALQYRKDGNWFDAIKSIPNMRCNKPLMSILKQKALDGKDIAIISSSPFTYCSAILRYWGFKDIVTIVSYHDTQRKKPSPDPYILAEKRMSKNNSILFCIGNDACDIEAATQLSTTLSNKTIRSVLFKPISNEANCGQDHTCEHSFDLFRLLQSDDCIDRNTPSFCSFINRYTLEKRSARELISELIKMGLLIKNDNNISIPTKLGLSKGIYETEKEKKDGSVYLQVMYSFDSQVYIMKALASKTTWFYNCYL